MKKSLPQILRLVVQHSRPRFRRYALGPFLIGALTAATEPTLFLRREFRVRFGYFSLPANALIYGANDLADHDTDQHNPKKSGYEKLLQKSDHPKIILALTALNLPFAALALRHGPRVLAALLGFRFFGLGYSLPPLRAKAVPILDGIFNILYIFPAIFAATLFSTQISRIAILAATLRCVAMHAFSAIPDIEADRRAGLSTAATFFGARGTLRYCRISRTLAAILSAQFLGRRAIFFGGIYSVLVLLAATRPIFAVYRRFPLVNFLAGMLLFFLIFFSQNFF